jgi:hypothetical protein
MLSCPANLLEVVATTAGLPPLTSASLNSVRSMIDVGRRAAFDRQFGVTYMINNYIEN